MIWYFILYAISAIIATVVFMAIDKYQHTVSVDQKEFYLAMGSIWPLMLIGFVVGFGMIKLLKVLSAIADWIVERLEGI